MLWGGLFHHRNGREYGSISDPLALDVRARVFAALRELGFRAGEADAALAQLGAPKRLAPVAHSGNHVVVAA